MNETVYFAAKPPIDLANILSTKSQAWTDDINTNGYLEKLRACYAAFHGCYHQALSDGHQITFSGEQGELVNIPVNQWRNIATHMHVMTCSNRPSVQCRSANTDYKSLVQTYLGNGILDYYFREKKVEVYLKQAVEYAIVYGAGFMVMEWDAKRGEEVDYFEETNTKVYEGDIIFENLHPFDVMYDGTKETGNHDWVLIRRWKNKFDLAAKYPEYETKIKPLPTKTDLCKMRIGMSSFAEETSDIPVYEFYHKKTDCMPNGRYMMYLDNEIVLQDLPMPYRVLPVFRIAPSNIHGTPYGYTPMFDLLPIQEGLNTLYSTILTNQNAFGVQNVLVPRGADIAVNQLVGGLNVIEYNTGQGEPKALNLTSTPAEVFKFLQILEQVMETLSGINSVARGQPEPSLKSGTALALVQSMSLQFLSGLQQSYVELVEGVGTAIIKMLQDFADTPRIVAISGVTNRSYVKEYSGTDIANITRVIVDIGNPMARCLKKDTPVLMYDGAIKPVQDITVGELIMGPDSKPRTVEAVNTGQEPMYDIHHNTLKDEFVYGCNESHILSLAYCSDDGRYGLKQYDKIDVSVKEFLSLPERQQRLFMGYRTGVEFLKKETTIPPYILGLWLGDGHSAAPTLTSMDDILVKEWTDYAHSLDLTVRIQDQEDNKSKLYFITSGKPSGSPYRNGVTNYLRDLNLIDNKHVPKNYLTSSRDDRLNLLAGFIDTDGSLSDNSFVISQKNDKLTDDIEYIAKSLGFKVSRRKVLSNSGPSRDGSERTIIGECNKLTISGDTCTIPTRLPRKQAVKKNHRFNHQHYGITIKPVGVGTYYGFTLKEEPHFVLGDFTVTHNTTAGRVQMAEQLLQYQQINAQQYVQLIHTGNLEAITEDIVHETLLMRAENESILNGETPQAVFVEDHKAHINYHRSILFDPELKKDGALVGRVQAHIQEHIQLLKTTDPNLLMLLNQQPLLPPQQPQIPPDQGMPNQGVPGEMMPPEAGQIGPSVINGRLNVPGMDKNVNIPKLPKVNPSLLANPQLQAESLGNLR